MAVAADDCFAQGGELMRLEAALAVLGEQVKPVTGRERVPLKDCRNRILADDIKAGRDVPPADNAAVDGWAVWFDDLGTAETILPVGGRIAAGHPLGRAPKRGAAYRIFTGAPMPKDADGNGPETVVMQEDCKEDGGKVRIPAGVKRGANARAAGEDIAKGETVLAKGKRLSPPDIGLAASLGLAELPVHSRLRVAVFSTGDELREPGEDLPGGAIYDSNRYGIMALLESLACEITDLGILRDDAEMIQAALVQAAKDHDVLITSGGVSTGDEDHVASAVERLGAMHFWRLAIKPGRPIAFGRIEADGHEAVIIGLPGNPVAVMVTFLRIARPAILKLSGAARTQPLVFRVPAGFAFKKKRERTEWLRARLVPDGKGGLKAEQHPKKGSGILTSMAEADGLIEVKEDLWAFAPGDPVDFLPFGGVMS